jgi:bifunctional NMN adenylyltransferase/nudix hydrolase
MSKEYDYLVFIGRFQPFHNGHLLVVNRALEMADKVIILCGSAFRPRCYRNPWTYDERVEMIRSCFSKEDNKRLLISPLMDVLYNDALWVSNVQKNVKELIDNAHDSVETKIGIIGHLKDYSSYYLRLFPQWGSVGVENHQHINSTDLRDAWFYQREPLNDDGELIPLSISKYLCSFFDSDNYKNIVREYAYIRNEQKVWDNIPVPPVFVTVNAVVIQSGHILLISRNNLPGQGLLSLPGGDLLLNERIEKSFLNRLLETTGLNLSRRELVRSIINKDVFDSPDRSDRGRTIAHVFHLALPNEQTLTSFDSKMDNVLWLPLAKLDPFNMFEDHYFIIQKMLGMI